MRNLALATAFAGWLAAAAVCQADDQPNFLFLITDDQSHETLSCYGETACQTPTLDRLAAGGLTIDEARHMGSWSGAVCLPSRTMIMTGRTVWHIPGRGRGKHADMPPDPQITTEEAADNSLPEVFNRAGYATFRTCKTGNSFAAANKRFQVVHEQMSREGTEANGSKWHADRFVEWMDSQAADDRPFLAYVGFSHPHDPRNATPELAAKYGASNEGPGETVPDAAPPLPKTWLPRHPFPLGQPKLRDEVAVQGVLTRRDVATVRNETGREFACIENIDTQIGRVLDALERSGRSDRTYVFFTSDHGMSVGRHGLMGKQNLYEHTWRVPFLVSGPDVEPGSRAAGGFYLLDVLPTLCELAGIEVPDTVEGKSFAPVIRGEADRIRDVMYGVYAGGTKPGIRAVKRGDWKLVEWDVLDGTVRRSQLFNLKRNPREFLDQHRMVDVVAATGHTPAPNQRNLAYEPEHAETLAAMRSLLRQQMTELDDPFPLAGLAP